MKQCPSPVIHHFCICTFWLTLLITTLTDRRVLSGIERCKCIFGNSILWLYHPFATESARVPEHVTLTTHIWQVQAYFFPLKSLNYSNDASPSLPVLYPFLKHKNNLKSNLNWSQKLSHLNSEIRQISELRGGRAHIYSDVWSLTNSSGTLAFTYFLRQIFLWWFGKCISLRLQHVRWYQCFSPNTHFW